MWFLDGTLAGSIATIAGATTTAPLPVSPLSPLPGAGAGSEAAKRVLVRDGWEPLEVISQIYGHERAQSASAMAVAAAAARFEREQQDALSSNMSEEMQQHAHAASQRARDNIRARLPGADPRGPVSLLEAAKCVFLLASPNLRSAPAKCV